MEDISLESMLTQSCSDLATMMFEIPGTKQNKRGELLAWDVAEERSIRRNTLVSSTRDMHFMGEKEEMSYWDSKA